MKDLFGLDLPEPTKKGKKSKERTSVLVHAQLLQVHGSCEGKKCGSCIHFFFRSYSKKYPKCEVSGLMGASFNHDWSSRWQACGKWEEDKDNG